MWLTGLSPSYDTCDQFSGLLRMISQAIGKHAVRRGLTRQPSESSWIYSRRQGRSEPRKAHTSLRVAYPRVKIVYARVKIV
jgi:hypothetical protein